MTLMSNKGDQSKSYINEQGKIPDDKKRYSFKDTNRPRRKKAKRACLACQKTHLTCGDERPCQRCIERDITDTCQDGVHKKAKHRHNALAKAFNIVSKPSWGPATATNRPPAQQQNSPASDHAAFSTSSRIFFSPESGLAYPSGHSQNSGGVPHSIQLNPQSIHVSPTFQDSPAVSQPQMGSMSGTYQTNSTNQEGNNPENMNRDGLCQIKKHYDTRESNPAYAGYGTGSFVGLSDGIELNTQTYPVSQTIQDMSQPSAAITHWRFLSDPSSLPNDHSVSRYSPPSPENQTGASMCLTPYQERSQVSNATGVPVASQLGSYSISRDSPPSHAREIQSQLEYRCWDHGCNGRPFATSSNLIRHQREKSGQAPKVPCPNCSLKFTRTTARNQHVQRVHAPAQIPPT